MGPSIKDTVYRRLVKGYLDRGGRLVLDYFYKVIWDSTWGTLDMTPDVYQMWIPKQATGSCVVVNIMKIWGFGWEEGCPACDQSPQ